MSDENKEVVHGGGVGFFGLLAVLFIGLKLTGYLEWSWLWVLAPLWLPFAVILIVATIALLVMLVIEAF
jgi:hypothetical protein